MAARYFIAWRLFATAKTQEERNYLPTYISNVRARVRTLSSDPLLVVDLRI